jgi:hypothetical protein
MIVVIRVRRIAGRKREKEGRERSIEQGGLRWATV